jgi:hypothetical protein
MMCQFFSTSAGLIDRVCLLSAFMACVLGSKFFLRELSPARIARPDHSPGERSGAQMSPEGREVKQKRRFWIR